MTNLLWLSSIIGVVTASFGCSQHADSTTFRHDEWLSDLHRAAAENRQDVMMTLLQNGADINARLSNGSTVLHMAAARGDLSAVKFILGKGINLELPNNNGLIALHLAAINNHQGVMRALLANGADVNARASDGSTLLHLAVVNDMMGSVEFILQSEKVLMSPKNNDLFTPLVLAERLGHLEVASLLREKIGNISIDALESAVVAGSLEDVRSLVLRGAEVNGLSSDGWAPLHVAARSNLTLVQFLVDHGADINMRVAQYGKTPLYEAAWWGYLDGVKYLVENGADINAGCIGCDGGYDETPMLAAYSYSHMDVVEYLRSKGGVM